MGFDIENDGSTEEPIHDFVPVTTSRKRLLEGSPAKVTRGVVIRAPRANTATIFVGGRRVTSDQARGTAGMPIDPGESITIPCRDASKLYVITASGAEQGAHWLGI